MSRKDKFLRQCCACRKFKTKEELVRITRDSETKSVKLNENNEFEGRSVYICKDFECVSNAVKKRKIESSLKISLPDSIKDKLYTVLTK